MELTSQTVGLLVQRALCLEALADKEGCTTRYVDLEGRPLEDFIIAGINVGPTMQLFAQDWLSGKETRLYHRFEEALQASNDHKSGKFVNFGLLEILFPAVAARLTCEDPNKVVSKMIELMHSAPTSDVAAMVGARTLAWTTSSKRAQKMADLSHEAVSAASPYAFYDAVFATAPTDSSSWQWIENYHNGLPLLSRQFHALQDAAGPILPKIKNAYDPVRAAHPDIRVGILADMSAAAIFLHLSFNEQT
jgi:hypothetical protein